MPDNYAEVCRGAKYKFAGHGDRNFGVLLEAFRDADPEMAADYYGVGPAINDFEAQMAALLGKPAAVFMPSGVMAQQIALRIWCDEADIRQVAYHPTCHMEIHEEDAVKQLHRLEPVLLGDAERLFTLDDLKAVVGPTACLLIELPQREIGGQLPAWDDLVAITEYARNQGMRTHLDGARMFETLSYYGKTAAEVGELFDSVYVSFYKGFGSVAGAILAGDDGFVAQAKVWKRRHGGDLISLYPYVVAAKYHMAKHIDEMGRYWQYAQQAAGQFNEIPGVRTVPQVPVCNMFHVYFDAPKADVEDALAQVIAETGVSMAANIRAADTGCMAEISFGDSFGRIPEPVVVAAFEALRSQLK